MRRKKKHHPRSLQNLMPRSQNQAATTIPNKNQVTTQQNSNLVAKTKREEQTFRHVEEVEVVVEDGAAEVAEDRFLIEGESVVTFK